MNCSHLFSLVIVLAVSVQVLDGDPVAEPQVGENVKKLPQDKYKNENNSKKPMEIDPKIPFNGSDKQPKIFEVFETKESSADAVGGKGGVKVKTGEMKRVAKEDELSRRERRRMRRRNRRAQKHLKLSQRRREKKLQMLKNRGGLRHQRGHQNFNKTSPTLPPETHSTDSDHHHDM